MKNFYTNRRLFIVSCAATSIAPFSYSANLAEKLTLTPKSTEGPFYPVDIPSDSDNDLLRVLGMDDTSPGQLAYVHGTVVDQQGTPIDGARVEGPSRTFIPRLYCTRNQKDP